MEGIIEMKKSTMVVLILMVLLSEAVACGSPYVYFTGYSNQEDFHSLNSASAYAYAWDFSKNECISLGLEGYLIEKDDSLPGCLIVLNQRNRLNSETEIVYCYQGRVQDSYTVHLPENLVRVYAWKNGWLYYSFLEFR